MPDKKIYIVEIIAFGMAKIITKSNFKLAYEYLEKDSRRERKKEKVKIPAYVTMLNAVQARDFYKIHINEDLSYKITMTILNQK